ncbi:MAG: hypothetical protein AAFV53_28735 [Myxococcota bacterium]
MIDFTQAVWVPSAPTDGHRRVCARHHAATRLTVLTTGDQEGSARLCVNAAIGYADENTDVTARALLNGAIRRASQALSRRQQVAAAVAITIHRQQAHIAHLGDAQAWHLHRSRLTRLTTPHTVETAMHRKQQPLPVSASIYSTMLNRGLGSREDQPEYQEPLPLHTGDWLLLCGGEVTQRLNPLQLHEALASGRGPDAMCTHLAEQAVHSGDPSTIVLSAIQIGIPRPARGR